MFAEVAETVREIALLAVPVLMAVVFHEVAHGYVAWFLGDPTAKQAGRLTLNPIKHLDVLGLLAFILTRMIGWAKPVPVDPRYFADPRRGMMLVALAGPVTNFILAVASSFVFRLLLGQIEEALPGSMAYRLLEPLAYMAAAGVSVNLALGVFNLLPIPPLDGSQILAGFLPPETAGRFMALGRYGFFFIILLAVTGVLGKVLLPVIKELRGLLL